MRHGLLACLLARCVVVVVVVVFLSYYYFCVNYMRSILCLYTPSLHQFLHPFLPHLGQHAHHDQVEDLVRQVLVQVSVAPHVQLQFRLRDQIVVVARQPRRAHEDIRQQRGQGLRAAALQLRLLFARRGFRGRRRERVARE